MPEVLDAYKASEGLVGSIRYGLKAPSIAKEQRELVTKLGSVLAKTKRQETVSVSVLGRGARKHGLVPAVGSDLAEAANLEENRARERIVRADEKHAEQQRADENYQEVSRQAEDKLAALEEEHAPMAARLEEITRRLEAGQAEVEELTVREAELKERAETEPTPDEVGGDIEYEGDKIVVKQFSYEHEVARRKKEHADAVEELSVLTARVELLASKAATLLGPLESIEVDMIKQRAEVQRARAHLETAEEQAKVAAVAGERRAAFANRSTGELDEELGRLLLRLETPPPAMNGLYTLVKSSQRRVEEVEHLLNDQQDQLDLFDSSRATSGRRLLAGSLLVFALLLVGVGEAMRRLILALGG